MWQEPQAKNTRSGTDQRFTGSRLVKPGVRGWYIRRLGEPALDVLGEGQAGGFSHDLMAHTGADQEGLLVRHGVALEHRADRLAVMAPADRLDLAVEGAVDDRQEFGALRVGQGRHGVD